jgi:hypothetical protein
MIDRTPVSRHHRAARALSCFARWPRGCTRGYCVCRPWSQKPAPRRQSRWLGNTAGSARCPRRPWIPGDRRRMRRGTRCERSLRRPTGLGAMTRSPATPARHRALPIASQRPPIPPERIKPRSAHRVAVAITGTRHRACWSDHIHAGASKAAPLDTSNQDTRSGCGRRCSTVPC